MKKLIILGAILSIVLMLGACNSEKTQKESEDTEVFTVNDVQMANEMVLLLEEKSSEFQTKAAEAIATGEIEQDKDGQLSEPLQELAKETVLQPFLEQYPNGIIGEEGDLTPKRAGHNTPAPTAAKYLHRVLLPRSPFLRIRSTFLMPILRQSC